MGTHKRTNEIIECLMWLQMSICKTNDFVQCLYHLHAECNRFALMISQFKAWQIWSRLFANFPKFPLLLHMEMAYVQIYTREMWLVKKCWLIHSFLNYKRSTERSQNLCHLYYFHRMCYIHIRICAWI